MLVLVFIYGNETMIWKEKERSRIMDIRKNSLRASLGIRKIDKILNTLIKERCGVTKGVDERIDVGVLRRFAHM